MDLWAQTLPLYVQKAECWINNDCIKLMQSSKSYQE
jgi:hypothetical protein